MVAEKIGIAPEHILANREPARPVRVPLLYDAPANLPVEKPGAVAAFCEKRDFIRRPLVPQRTSFWIGVGFGILVTGVLGYIAWQLFNVEIGEAIVLSLGM